MGVYEFNRKCDAFGLLCKCCRGYGGLEDFGILFGTIFTRFEQTFYQNWIKYKLFHITMVHLHIYKFDESNDCEGNSAKTFGDGN